MVRFSVAAALAVLLVSGVFHGAGAQAKAQPASPYQRLRTVLAVERLGPEQRAAVSEVAVELGAATLDLLAGLAEDTTAAVPARVNALLLLGEEGVASEIRAFRSALRDRRQQVRAAAAMALRDLLEAAPSSARGLLALALEDPDPWVQAKALESLADHDVPLLRRYLAGDPPAELRPIAEELVRVGEQRGAALAPAAGAVVEGIASPLPEGSHVRAAEDGTRLVFVARRHWPSWEAAVGELWVAPPGGEARRIGSGVEVVAGVVPAFFSPDGRRLVYEAERRILVRDLETGDEREVGGGIAPRPIPFTDTFVFLRERVAERTEQRGEVELVYDVLRASFASVDEPEAIGTLSAVARMEDRGAYSPVRWARVRERGEVFYLEVGGMERFLLPDPFESPVSP